MNLNSVEWSRAQELLLNLIQTLSPVAELDISILNQRFFIPPSFDTSFRHPVRLLTTLQSMQKQVEEIIGPLPQELPKLKEVSTQPLFKQAKKLIHQVQTAIGELCHSEHLRNPQEKPLKEALIKLKPDLDRIIEEIAPGLSEEPKPLSTATLPPFVPLPRSLLPIRKKKKRPGFWSKEDEEERNNS